MGNSCSPGCRLWFLLIESVSEGFPSYSFMASFVLSFFPLDVLDGMWDLIESVSEGFLTYPWVNCFLWVIIMQFLY